MLSHINGQVTLYWGLIYAGILLRDSKDDIREDVFRLARMLRHPAVTTVSQLLGELFDDALKIFLFMMQIALGAMVWPVSMGLCIHAVIKPEKSSRNHRASSHAAE